MSIVGSNNVQVEGDNNNITIEQAKSRSIALEKIHVVLRNESIFIGFIFMCVIVNMSVVFNKAYGIVFWKYSLPITLAIVLLYVFYLVKRIPFLSIIVKEDRFIAYNEEILFSDIKNFEFKGNGFRYSLRDRPEKMKSLTLRSQDNARFVYDTIYRYALASDTLMYHNSI